jgi:carboxyl-terminal processing protease
MKRFLLAGAVAVSVFAAQAWALSPAQDLFDQAGFYLSFNYNGFAQVDPEKLVEKYQVQLERACAGKGEACDFETAESITEAMLEEIGDEHTYYLPPEDLEGFGVGAGGGDAPEEQITMGMLPAFFGGTGGASLRVVELLEGSAAEEAGIQRLDRIFAMNGQPFPATRDAVQRFFQTADGGFFPVKLSVERGGRNLEITVTPRRTDLRLLPFMNVVNGVARIRVLDFTGFNRVAPKLHQLVKKAQGLNVRAIVVDLRDNPGGTATECLAGASAFMPDVSRIRESRRERYTDAYKDGRVFFRDEVTSKENTYYTIPSPAKWTGRLAVLVNRESASCAEYFASDVQFNKRGPVLGERSYGLGNTGTRVFELINGGGLAVTLLKSLRLDNTPYPERVNPDVFVRDNFENLVLKGKDDVMERALQELGVQAN